MYGLIILSVLVAGGSIAWIADEFDSDDDSSNEDEPKPVEPPVEEGQNLLFDGADSLIGTNGDDTLAAGQDEDLAPEEVLLLGGDDVATVDVQIGAGVSGGEGNDHLTSTSVGNQLDGGEGNDTLHGIDANNLFGGAGNDSITFESGVESIDQTAQISGGEGDDTISLSVDVGIDAPDRGGAIISGGDGSDSFEVMMHLENSTVDVDGSGGPLTTGIARITDFDPSEDSLLIQLESDQDAQDRVFQASFEQVEEDGQFVSTFTFTFPENINIADAAEARATLTVVSDTPFGLGDVSIVRA